MRREIRSDGHVVGYLTLAPFETVTSPGDRRFERSQLKASWSVGLLCMLAAALIAMWVARRVLRPVRRVAQATHRLAAGEYDSRVQVESDDEVGQLARDFNTMADTLARNESMRREFIADVSHELRTPLGVLHGELEAMEDGVRRLDATAVKSLQAEVATLNKLVNDLYDLSLADVGALAFRHEPLALDQVLDVTVEAFRQRFAEAGLRLQVAGLDTPLRVQGDERRLQQLFNNLLENAVRYTDPGGVVRLVARRASSEPITSVTPMTPMTPSAMPGVTSASASPSPGLVVPVLGAAADAMATLRDDVVVDLMDAAPGVAEDRLARLFDRFYRGEASRSRAHGGAGLGLAIVRSIVLAHGGRIEARSSPLGGLWIELRLPCLPDPPPPELADAPVDDALLPTAGGWRPTRSGASGPASGRAAGAA